MSDELKIKLVIDKSQAAKQLAELPDDAERAARRSRKPWEGQGAARGSASAYASMPSQREIEKQKEKEAEIARKAAEKSAEAQKKADDKKQKEENNAYVRNLKFQSKVQEDQDRAAAEEIARRLRADEALKQEQERAAIEEYLRNLKFNSKIQQDKDEAAAKDEESQRKAAEKKQKEDEKARKKEEKDTEDWHRRNLRLKLKELDKEAKEKDKAASKAGEWEEKFTDKLTGGLFKATTYANLFLGALSTIGGWFKDMVFSGFERGQRGGASEAAYGTQATDMFETYITLKNLSDMTEEESNKITENLASMAQDIATGVSGRGATAFRYFGLSDFKKVEQEGFQMREFLGMVSDKYQREGQTPQFQQFARELFGEDWKKLRPAMAAGRDVLTSEVITLGSSPAKTPFTAGLNNVNTQRVLLGLPPLENLRGGGGAGGFGMPMMTPVTSIQSMGGGDVFSAVNRGPMDTIAKATEETAVNTRALADKQVRSRMDPNGVISVVRE